MQLSLVMVKLPAPTADPVELTRAAHRLLPLIEDGGRYARAGIMLTDLRPAAAAQPLEIFRYAHEVALSSRASAMAVERYVCRSFVC